MESTIRAYQKILLDHRFKTPVTKSEEFAQKRFLKKMELPDQTLEDVRAAKCWADFIEFDHTILPPRYCPTGRWYVVRQFLHGIMHQFSLGDVAFTNGSEFNPTNGENSIEAKLAASDWSVTRGCRDLAIEMIRSNYALTRAFKKRYERVVGSNRHAADKWLWKQSKRLCKCDPSSREALEARRDWIWLAKSELVFAYEEGSRFSTVRKNNEKNRPINIECLLNVLVQRRIGNGIRKLIKDVFGVDLDIGKDVHAVMIACSEIATIDLKNASDSVLVRLIKFLFPKFFVNLLMDSRSPFILGPDGDYHVLNKISAMGNGFTFELMTLIILALTRTYDCESSVFGDDIIVKNDVAEAVVADLESVGFIVNLDKSFIRSEFRESCGANYFDDEGYVKSFDFEYPDTIIECATLYNKCALLALDFPSFEELRLRLHRSTPPALRGGLLPAWSYTNGVPSAYLPPYFACGEGKLYKDRDELLPSLRSDYQLSGEKFTTFIGWEYVPKLRTKTRVVISVKHHWAKYLMYLHSGCVTDDTIRGTGSWRRVAFISDGHSTWRKSALREALRGRCQHVPDGDPSGSPSL